MSLLHKNHFEMFSLPQRFGIDQNALSSAYRAVQAAVHPDRFASAGATQQRIAMQMATQVNEAYRTLRQPMARAAYLCEMMGAPIEAESNTAMPAEFLIAQMNWRESLDEARAAEDEAALARLSSEIEQARAERIRQLGELIDTIHDYQQAAAVVRQLMFVERFSTELAAVRIASAD